MNKLVSIIMSVYNEEEKILNQAIESILNQTYNNLEFIIILDNPNRNDLRNLINNHSKNDKRIKFIENKNNLGIVKSLNKALKYCNGQYIARMDADDIAIFNRVDIQKKYLEENNLDFIFSSVEYIDENGNFICNGNNKNITQNRLNEILKILNVSNHPTWFLKKQVYESLNGYREIKYCEDYDFILRAINKGYSIGKLNVNTLKYRMTNQSISRSNSLKQFLNTRILAKAYKNNSIENLIEIQNLIDKYSLNIDNKDEKKFKNAILKLTQGTQNIKKRLYLKGGVDVLESMIISKYHILKIYDTLRYKLLNL